MKTTNILLSLSLLLLSVAGCTSDEQGDGPVTNGKGEYAVNFSGNINLTQTKADTEGPEKVGNGVKAKISTFEKDDTSSPIVDAKEYTYEVGGADDSGKFNGDGDYVMYLAKGFYDFYAVSTNYSSADTIPAFTNGISTAELQNRVDYLYANSKNVSIPGASEASNNITLSFEHKAVRITIDVKSGTGLELTGWQDGDDHATITPPAISGCKMTLTSGAITPATSVSTTPDNMVTTAVADNASTASYTMLPLAATVAGGDASKLTVTFKVKAQIGDRTAENRTYTATLTAPNTSENGSTTAFQSGKNYTYTATLNPTAITFTGATVTDWTTVTTTDDLKPSEPDPTT